MPTLQDVARLAGVSGATVSNVLRQRGAVSAATIAKVQQVARDLGYRPNLVARALAERRSPTIAVFFTNILNPFYSEFAFAAERAARRREHFLLICNAATPAGSLDTAYLNAVAGRLAEGLIVLGSDLGRQSLLEMLPAGIPVVLSTWEEIDMYPTVPCVTVDFHKAGQLAGTHLAELGHRRIGIVAGTEHPEIVGDVAHHVRLAGLRHSLATYGITVSSPCLQIESDTIEGGRLAANRLLDLDPTVTAIAATNDLLAIGALQAAAERQIRVPDSLSVIGLTGIWMSAQVRPALTTIDIATASLADGSVNLLLDLIDDPATVSASALRVVGTPALIRRASTGPPAR